MDNPTDYPLMFLDDIAEGLEKVEISFINERNSYHLPKNIMYITKNLVSSDSLADDFESMPEPCKCVICSDDCSCAVGGLIAYKNQFLSEDFISDLSKPILECSGLCECEMTCQNRVVQHGIKFRLQVFMTKNKGFGVRTLEHIPKFAFVCEYVGELIDKAEAEQRLKNRHREDPNYIFILKEHSDNQSYLCTIIDPSYKGNVGRYLNHSCSPNLFPLPVRVNSMLPRICFFSNRNIDPFEELTYNYGIEATQEDEKDKYNLRVNHHLKPCLCSSPVCNGVLPFDAEALV